MELFLRFFNIKILPEESFISIAKVKIQAKNPKVKFLKYHKNH